MTEYISGPTMVLSWATSSGTSALAADYRTCTWTPSVAYVEASAGSDTQVARLTALKDATAEVSLVSQAGTGGTALLAILGAGQAGTLTIQPEGTATGKRKITFPCYADGAKTEFPYNDITVMTCGFTAAGSVLTAWTDAFN